MLPRPPPQPLQSKDCSPAAPAAAHRRAASARPARHRRPARTARARGRRAFDSVRWRFLAWAGPVTTGSANQAARGAYAVIHPHQPHSRFVVQRRLRSAQRSPMERLAPPRASLEGQMNMTAASVDKQTNTGAQRGSIVLLRKSRAIPHLTGSTVGKRLESYSLTSQWATFARGAQSAGCCPLKGHSHCSSAFLSRARASNRVMQQPQAVKSIWKEHGCKPKGQPMGLFPVDLVAPWLVAH